MFNSHWRRSWRCEGDGGLKYIAGLVVAVFCASLFFLWVNAGVRQVAIFPYKPNQISVALVLAVGLTLVVLPKWRRTLVSVISSNRLFVVCFMTFLFLQLVTILWIPPQGNVTYILAKQFSYFVCAMLIAGMLHSKDRFFILSGVYLGFAGGLVVFSAVFSYLSSVVGSGIVSLVVRALFEGNSGALQFEVFPLLFNFVDGGLIAKGDEDFQGTALRNTLVGVFIVTSILFWCRSSGVSANPLFNFPQAGVLVTVLSAFFIVASVSRSNVLVFAMAASFVVLARLGGAQSKVRRTRLERWSTVLVGVGIVMVSGNLLVGFVEGLAAIGVQRFGNLSGEPRLIMYADALAGINSHLLTGLGLGAEVERFGHRVHNVFLAAWYEGGLLLFFASLAMYFSLVRSVWKCGVVTQKLDASARQQLLLGAGGILSLAILPLFRPLVSGEAGAFTLVEWFCIAVVLAETANIRETRRTSSAD